MTNVWTLTKHSVHVKVDRPGRVYTQSMCSPSRAVLIGLL